MNEKIKDKILDFNYAPLVDDIYQCIDDNSYDDVYAIVKNKNSTNINKKLTQFRTYKTKAMIVIMIILNFINNLFVRICGYVVVTSIVGIAHSFINADSFLYFSHLGQNIYDQYLQSMFSVSSSDIILWGSQGMVAASTTSPMSQSSSYLLFYVIITTLLLLVIWIVVFIYKMVKKESSIIDQKTITIEESFRQLGCNKYDSLKYMQYQLKKKYLKNQINRKKQLHYVQSYVMIIKNNELNFCDQINDNEQKKLLIKLIQRGIIYFLNLISKGIFLSGIFILAYYRYVDFFINKGYLENLWKFFTDIHKVVQGGIIAWFPIYQQSSEHIQITLSVTFVIMCIVVLFQCGVLFIQPLKRLQDNYRNYLILNRNIENSGKFKDSYSLPWLVLMIIIGIFGLLIILLQ